MTDIRSLEALANVPEKQESLLSLYKDSPVLCGLLQLANNYSGGLISPLDKTLQSLITSLAEHRQAIFFSELYKNHLLLTPENISSIEFVHRFIIAYRAILLTQRDEKIRFFARLLLNTCPPITTDKYEEYLSILNDLSYREIQLLLILSQFENDTPFQSNEGALARSSRFWQSFLVHLQQEFELNSDEAAATLSRLNRSGCYSTFTGSMYDYGGDQGRLTPIFFELKQRISAATQS